MPVMLTETASSAFASSTQTYPPRLRRRSVRTLKARTRLSLHRSPDIVQTSATLCEACHLKNLSPMGLMARRDRRLMNWAIPPLLYPRSRLPFSHSVTSSPPSTISTSCRRSLATKRTAAYFSCSTSPARSYERASRSPIPTSVSTLSNFSSRRYPIVVANGDKATCVS